MRFEKTMVLIGAERRAGFKNPSVSFRLFNPELSQRLDNSGFFTLFV